MNFPRLFAPGRIGSLITRNRVKYAATETNFNTGDGFVTEREVAYMEAQPAEVRASSPNRALIRTRRARGRAFAA
jgi:2,4-dienoyl-CoA reductase-like NADH-dependent reductase (Old Yellow Enzyme family)